MKESRLTAARANGSSGSNAGLAAALRLGWAATVMAVQEQLEQQELSKLTQQQPQEGPGQRDDYSSTAAVLARARQAMEMLEGLP